MALVAKFTFNPFQENTYIVYDETKECVIFDPGCYTQEEKKKFQAFISSNSLKPVRLINTHCHIDHVFGNRFCADLYQLPLEIHDQELPVLKAVPQVADMYGIPMSDDSPEAGRLIKEGEVLTFGQTSFKALLTPGHSPGSLSFYFEDDQFVIGGDVLFREGIGRTDLPGGSYPVLIQSIKEQLFVLPDGVTVYAGHMGETTIGHEKKHNPFLN